jgi:hypothetical protein
MKANTIIAVTIISLFLLLFLISFGITISTPQREAQIVITKSQLIQYWYRPDRLILQAEAKVIGDEPIVGYKTYFRIYCGSVVCSEMDYTFYYSENDSDIRKQGEVLESNENRGYVLSDYDVRPYTLNDVTGYDVEVYRVYTLKENCSLDEDNIKRSASQELCNKFNYYF